MKKPNIILNYLLEPKRKLFFVEAMFNHLYLASCITDLVVRLCTVQEVPESVDPISYEELRTDIAAHCINQLDTFEDNEYLTWQIFEILTQCVKKCYLMSDAKQFFEQIMNPFQFIGLLRFTFKGDHCTRQGAEFLNLLIFNCFVADPDEAKLECLEINFGFQIVVPGEKEEESKEDAGNNESTAMK